MMPIHKRWSSYTGICYVRSVHMQAKMRYHWNSHYLLPTANTSTIHILKMRFDQADDYTKPLLLQDGRAYFRIEAILRRSTEWKAEEYIEGRATYNAWSDWQALRLMAWWSKSWLAPVPAMTNKRNWMVALALGIAFRLLKVKARTADTAGLASKCETIWLNIKYTNSMRHRSSDGPSRKIVAMQDRIESDYRLRLRSWTIQELKQTIGHVGEIHPELHALNW